MARRGRVDGGTDYRLRALEHARSITSRRRARPTRRWPRCSSACAPGPDEDAAALDIEARTLKAPEARREPGLVRFRRAVRRPALAARLHRAGAALPGGHRLGRAAAVARHEQRRAPLHLAGGRVLRSSGKAAVVGGGRRRTSCIARAPNSQEFRAHRQPADRDAHARIHGAAALAETRATARLTISASA